MEAKESLEIRTQMAEMHDNVLKRINTAYNNKQYIEVCWLCYACFENRVNRVLEKICISCTKDSRTDNRPIGITTKLECYARLIKNNYPPMQSENYNLITTVKGWCKERNTLIHGMISLDYYNNADKEFQSLAKRGIKLVKQMYSLGGNIRQFYYEADDMPSFDEKVVKACKLKKKCIKEN